MGILDQFRLEGKLALVTGAASGLGAAIALALAEAGASVACHGNRRSAEPTSETIQASVGKSGGESRSFTADLSQPGAADSLYESVCTAMGEPDIVVNNAGTIHREPAENFDMQAWMTVLQVNLNSVFRLCQLAGRAMLARRRGKIVNIASLLAFQGGIRVPAYAASKGGLVQLTKALANEWAARNVQVNAIAPGYFRTDNTSALQSDETRNHQILDRIPAGRWGEPEDIAGAAVFLASPASNYVTGEVVVVDGGWMAR
jgi:2-dehydro-3-deoxy-D-gluconate 5-dehydrogenase